MQNDGTGELTVGEQEQQNEPLRLLHEFEGVLQEAVSSSVPCVDAD